MSGEYPLSIYDSGDTGTFIEIEPAYSPDIARLSLSNDSRTETVAQITVFDAILIREALDQFIANAVGANV